jgi:hypothetical protein
LSADLEHLAAMSYAEYVGLDDAGPDTHRRPKGPHQEDQMAGSVRKNLYFLNIKFKKYVKCIFGKNSGICLILIKKQIYCRKCFFRLEQGSDSRRRSSRRETIKQAVSEE